MNRHASEVCARAGWRWAALAAAIAGATLWGAAFVVLQGQVAMPNAAQMSGVPLPASDLPNGAISVRLVRETVSANLVGRTVELHGGPGVLTLTTDENGRAQFTGVASGTAVHARAVVDGVPLVTQTFPVPATGGVRVMLVAAGQPLEGRSAEDETPPAAAGRGEVVIGGRSQFVVELEDDTLEVYYLLEIANNAPTAVVTAEPLVFELPPGARGAAVLEDSSRLARAEGPRITLNSPFPPGFTRVQAAYEMPYGGDQVTISQPLPARLELLSLAVERVGSVHVESTQMSSQGDVPADGKTYLIGNGPAIPAGQALTFTITGLPHRATWPRTVALALAAIVLCAGIWVAVKPGGEAEAEHDRRRTLQGRRDRLFADLVQLEEQHRAGQTDERHYATRRGELVAQLEQVYLELDRDVAA